MIAPVKVFFLLKNFEVGSLSQIWIHKYKSPPKGMIEASFNCFNYNCEANNLSGTCYWKTTKSLEDEGLEKQDWSLLTDWRGVFTANVIQALTNAPFGRWKLLNPQNETYCFYGGSFNPWHQGHRQCLESHPSPEQITIIVDKNPKKQLSARGDWERFLKVDREIPEKFLVYPGFLNTLENPTSTWIEKLKTQSPNKKIDFIMGEDSFLSLQSWFHPETLVKCLNKIWVTPRGGKTTLIQRQAKWARQINKHIEIEVFDSHPYENISSTQLRK